MTLRSGASLDCMMRRTTHQISGHDAIVSVRDGHEPRPAAASLLDLSYDEVAPGRVVLGFRPTRRFADGSTVPGGVLAGVADLAMTTAVRTTILAATGVVSTSLTVEHLLPVAIDSGHLRCEGHVVEGGVVDGTRARATITDRDGRVVLRAEATCRALPVEIEGSPRQPGAHQAA
jgi:acyl-coenzyme A thioesterase PaaI-like protein